MCNNNTWYYPVSMIFYYCNSYMYTVCMYVCMYVKETIMIKVYQAMHARFMPIHNVIVKHIEDIMDKF